jgi:uncharacterized membrane protein
MSTTAPSLRPTAALRGKYVIFAFVFVMLLYVLQHNERFLIQPDHPVWAHYEPFKWWLLPHGLAGACAILLGPMQFSDRLRQRFTKLHRVVGRVYVFGALVAAPIGVYIQYLDERVGGPRTFTAAAAVDAFLLMTTTAIAFVFAIQRKIQLHRHWMTRSYAVAIVFLEVRVITGVLGWDRNLAFVEATVWACLPLALLFADMIIQWQELKKVRPTARATAQAAD